MSLGAGAGLAAADLSAAGPGGPERSGGGGGRGGGGGGASRSRIYAAQYDAFRQLLTFLLEDCCQGRPEVCAPLFDLAASCRAPERCKKTCPRLTPFCSCAPATRRARSSQKRSST